VTDSGKRTLRRFHIQLPEDLLDQAKTIAERRGQSVADVLKQFVALGLDLERASQNEGGGVWFREHKDAKLERIRFY